MAGSTIMAQEEDSVAELALDLGAIYNRDHHHYLSESVCPLWLRERQWGLRRRQHLCLSSPRAYPP